MGKIERLAYFLRAEQVEGAGLINCHHLAAGQPLRAGRLRIDKRQQRAAILQPVERQVGRQLQLADLKVGIVWVARDLERIGGRPEKARRLARQCHHVIHHVRQGDVAWCFLIARQQMAQS